MQVGRKTAGQITRVSFAKRHLGLPKKLGIIWTMANWSRDAVGRLAAAVTARRDGLGRTQIDVWRAKGPSNSTLTAIENVETTTITPLTLRKLDTGLSWPEGTAAAILAGEDIHHPLRTPLEAIPTAKLAEIASEALSELRRRITHIAPDNGELGWGGLDPRGHWPEDDEEPEDLRE